MTRPTTEISATNRAFLALICGLVWLVVFPTFFVIGLFKLRANDAPQNTGQESSDLEAQKVAAPMVNILHDGDTSI